MDRIRADAGESTVSPRELALELAQLPAPDRERLLAEVPSGKRMELAALIVEMAERMARPRGDNFEAQLRHLELGSNPLAELRRLNHGQLRILLSGEAPAVQHHLVNAISAGDIDSWPPSIRQAAVMHMYRRLQSSGIEAENRNVGARSWRNWLRRFRQ